MQINSAYKPISTAKNRFVRLQGGAGSGKSVAVAQTLLLRIINQKGNRILCFRKVGRTVRDSIFRTFIDLIYDYGITPYFKINQSIHTIKYIPTGSELICLGLDDSEKIKSIREPNIAWLEEATEFSFKDFQQINLRLRKLNFLNQIFLSYNPVTRANWVYEKFEEQKLYADKELFIKTTYKDNAFIPDEYKDELRRLERSDENYYRVYGLGEWGEILRGLIFTDYEIVDEFPQDIDPIYGIDFGFVDPLTMMKCGLRGERDLYVDEFFYQRGKTTTQLGTHILSSDIFPNAPIYCDNIPGDIQELNNMGIAAQPAIKGPGSIVSGIRTLHKYNLKITSRSTNLLKELSRYKWKEDKAGNILETPIDAFNHGIDAMRYAVVSHFYQPQYNPIIGSYDA